MKKYDYLIVGAGLFGAVFAHQMSKRGKRCYIIDKRNHIGGNCFTKEVEGINVHVYGAHIFHTSDSRIWNYVSELANFNRYTNSPLASCGGKLYNLPFNMNTFYSLWGVRTPEDAMAIISAQREEIGDRMPRNLEEQAISLVGRDIYEKLIKGYTEKQWGRKCAELPSFVIKRLPVRFTFDNNYFNDKFQGIPEGGYTQIFQKLLSGVDVALDVDYFSNRQLFDSMAERVLYTGPIDEFYGFRYGKLAYRSLRFETDVLNMSNFQGNAVVNYVDAEIPYTRIIEHKHFEFGQQKSTVISREYPCEWKQGDVPYYPVNDLENTNLFSRYRELANSETRHLFGGRLADYKYYDMHDVIGKALDLALKTDLGVGG